MYGDLGLSVTMFMIGGLNKILSIVALWLLTYGTNPPRTAYLNCEVRIFDFTEQSTKDDAHFTESEESKKARV